MAVNGGRVGTKKGPNWGHVTFTYLTKDVPKFPDILEPLFC